MQLIARLPMWAYLPYPCGDADKDGRQELWAQRSPENVWVLEHRGNDEFDSIPLPFWVRPWAVGDLDRDGKADIICQRRDSVLIYEARDSVSFPDSLVWFRDDGPISANQTYTLDLDGDSALEFSYIGNSPFERRVLYECVGDNQYLEVDSFTARYHWVKATGMLVQTDDMDGDGLPEAVVGSIGDYVAVYEAPVNDTCVRIWDRDMCPGSYGMSKAVAFARDMDGNGKDEFIVYSVSSSDEAYVSVFEAVANDSFEVVWQTEVDGYYGAYYYRAAAGDVTGDSVPEFAVTTGGWLLLFRCTGPAEYSLMWQMEYIYEGLNIYDINSDGRCEVLYSGRRECQFWEWLPVGVGESAGGALDAVQVRPSVVSRGGVVRLVGLADGTSVAVLDASGRVVRVTSGDVVQTRGLSVGMYFLRMTAGRSAVLKKLLVVE